MNALLQTLRANIWIVLAVVVIIAYAIWNFWFKAIPTPENRFIKPEPAVSAKKKSGAVLKPPIKIVPKDDVKDKFPEAQIADDEEWVDTIEVPPAPNGAVVLTKIDTVSGEVTNQIKNNKAPWIAFEDTNYIGGGVEGHWGGEKKAKLYYQRDVLRVKDVHLQLGVQGKLSDRNPAEGFVDVNLEFRF